MTSSNKNHQTTSNSSSRKKKSRSHTTTVDNNNKKKDGIYVPITFRSVLRIRPVLKKERDDPIVLESLNTTTNHNTDSSTNAVGVVVLHPRPEIIIPNTIITNSGSGNQQQQLSLQQQQQHHHHHQREQQQQERDYSFDRIFTPNTNQEKIYSSIGLPIAIDMMEQLKTNLLQQQQQKQTSSSSSKKKKNGNENLLPVSSMSPTNTHLVFVMGPEMSGTTYTCWGGTTTSLPTSLNNTTAAAAAAAASISTPKLVSIRKQETDGMIPRVLESLFSQAQHHHHHYSSMNHNHKKKETYQFGVNITMVLVHQCKNNLHDCDVYDLIHHTTTTTGTPTPSTTNTSSIFSVSSKMAASLLGNHLPHVSGKSVTNTQQTNNQNQKDDNDNQIDSTNCQLSEGQSRTCTSIEMARTCLQKALERSKKMIKCKKQKQKHSYQSTILIEIQPVLLTTTTTTTTKSLLLNDAEPLTDSSSSTTTTIKAVGGTIVVVEMAQYDEHCHLRYQQQQQHFGSGGCSSSSHNNNPCSSTTSSVVNHRLKDSVLNQQRNYDGDVYAAMFHCLQTLQQQQVQVQLQQNQMQNDDDDEKDVFSDGDDDDDSTNNNSDSDDNDENFGTRSNSNSSNKNRKKSILTTTSTSSTTPPIKRVPFQQHKVMTLLQPFFSRCHGDQPQNGKVDVTLFVTMSGTIPFSSSSSTPSCQHQIHYDVKKDLLLEIEELHKPTLNLAVHTGVTTITSKSGTKLKNSKNKKIKEIKSASTTTTNKKKGKQQHHQCIDDNEEESDPDDEVISMKSRNSRHQGSTKHNMKKTQASYNNKEERKNHHEIHQPSSSSQVQQQPTSTPIVYSGCIYPDEYISPLLPPPIAPDYCWPKKDNEHHDNDNDNDEDSYYITRSQNMGHHENHTTTVSYCGSERNMSLQQEHDTSNNTSMSCPPTNEYYITTHNHNNNMNMNIIPNMNTNHQNIENGSYAMMSPVHAVDFPGINVAGMNPNHQTNHDKRQMMMMMNQTSNVSTADNHHQRHHEQQQEQQQQQQQAYTQFEVAAASAPVEEEANYASNHAVFNYMKTINKVVAASAKKGRQVIEKISVTSTGAAAGIGMGIGLGVGHYGNNGDTHQQKDELIIELQKRTMKLDKKNNKLLREIVLLRERIVSLEQENMNMKLSHQRLCQDEYITNACSTSDEEDDDDDDDDDANQHNYDHHDYDGDNDDMKKTKDNRMESNHSSYNDDDAYYKDSNQNHNKLERRKVKNNLNKLNNKKNRSSVPSDDDDSKNLVNANNGQTKKTMKQSPLVLGSSNQNNIDVERTSPLNNKQKDKERRYTDTFDDPFFQHMARMNGDDPDEWEKQQHQHQQQNVSSLSNNDSNNHEYYSDDECKENKKSWEPKSIASISAKLNLLKKKDDPISSSTTTTTTAAAANSTRILYEDPLFAHMMQMDRQW